MSTENEIAVSYDLSNEFFALFLDRRMAYSGANFDGVTTLEEAQTQKLAWHYAAAGIEPGMTVLDIGCGWGANLEYLAVDRGVTAVHGITLSRAQYEAVLARAIPRTTVERLSYRQFAPAAPFDAAQSMGMIEHICTPEEAKAGHAVDVYRDFLARVHRWTRPGARFSLQSILRDRVPRQADDLRDLAWMGRTIMPGAMSPRLEELTAALSSLWELVELRTRRLDYARTCAEWRARLQANEALVRARWGDALYRDYDRYLRTCVRGFEAAYLSLAQMALLRLEGG